MAIWSTLDRGYTTNGLNQYTQAGPAIFTYDANGNLTGDGWITFTYDIENRLVEASGSKSLTLTYDPLGRLWETDPGTGTDPVTRFLYDGDALVAEYDYQNTLQHRYVHGNGVDNPLLWYDGSTVSEATRRHLYANWQGSIAGITDGKGELMNPVNAYDAYGIPNPTNIGRFQYTGQIYLPELGIYHYKARAYSATLGRFLQTDPIGYEDQYNLYAYVGGDPVNMLDPTGLSGCADAGVDNPITGDQTGLSGDCIDASAFSILDGDDPTGPTDVSSATVDASAVTNMPSIQNDAGPDENIAEFSEDGSFNQLNSSTSNSGSNTVGRAIGSSDSVAVGHSHPDLEDANGRKKPNIEPGYKNRSTNDGVQVNGGRPNYIINRGTIIVIERSGGQFRARVVRGSVTNRQRRGITRRLNKIQRTFR